MIVLILLSLAVTLLILVQTPKAQSKLIRQKVGAKRADLITKTTYGLSMAMFVLTLALF